MTDFTVAPDQVDRSASVFQNEAEYARNVLSTFKAQVQSLQDMYQVVPPDKWNTLMDDLDIYMNGYHDGLAGIGSGLRKNYANYTDIEAANSKLMPVDGYTPITDFDMGLQPAFSTVAQVAPGPGSAPTPSKAALDAQPSGAPQQVNDWVTQAIGILEDSGVPASQLNAQDLWIIIQHESSGDPNAINTWDSNAAAGIPSQGLMQVIPPNFQKYALPGHTNILNPVDNIIAGTRYALATYGSLDNVPGVLAVHNGQPYVPY